MDYVVTVRCLQEVTVALSAPADATCSELRELALRQCDAGVATFETVSSETVVRYSTEWPTPLHDLVIRVQAGPLN